MVYLKVYCGGKVGLAITELERM